MHAVQGMTQNAVTGVLDMCTRNAAPVGAMLAGTHMGADGAGSRTAE